MEKEARDQKVISSCFRGFLSLSPSWDADLFMSRTKYLHTKYMKSSASESIKNGYLN